MHRLLPRFSFLLPLCSSLLLIFSFPRFDQGYLAWVCLLPLFIYCRRYVPSLKKAFTAGMMAGLPFFLYVHAYLALSVDFLFPRFLGILVVIAGSFYSALFFALFALSFSYFSRITSFLMFVLAVPSSWVLLEYLRSVGLLGHTGGFLGYSQVHYTPILQSISLYGYWGLSFLMVFFQTILFVIFQEVEWKKDRIYAALAKIAIPAGLFLSLLICGIILPPFFPAWEREEALRIILVQGNIPQEDVLNPKKAPDNFQRYLDLTKQAHEEYGPAHLIVWPETVFSTSVAQKYPSAREEVARLAVKVKTPLFFGAMEEDFTGKVYNSILLQKPKEPTWEPQRYDKIRLVPIAEYFPFPEILNKWKSTGVLLGTYTPGTQPYVFQSNDFYFSGLICFESYFPRPALDMARRGAEHIFVLTNDAWFLDSIGLEQHARVAVIRALETGVGVTQVANTGYTVSYNYEGRKILRLPPHKKGFILLESTLPQRLTLYRLWGDYFLYLCFFILAISLLPGLKKKKR